MFSFFNKNKKALTANINGQVIEVKNKETLLQAALRHNIEFPYSCRVGGCATCKCRLTSGKVRELTDTGYILSDYDLDNGYILACQSVPKTDIRIELDKTENPVVQLQGAIVAQHKLTHDITQLIIQPETPLTYRPGQFANLTLLRLPDISRSYSFASASVYSEKQASCLEFYVREVPGGRFSGEIHRNNLVGEKIMINGPMGDFWLRPAQNPIVMIAGGSGLAPIISMLQAEAYASRHRPTVLLFGARTQQDLYSLDTLEAIKQQWTESFEFIPVLSEEPKHSNWSGHTGLVTHIIPELFQSNPTLTNGHGYLCGPPAMIDAAEDALIAQGIHRAHIHADRFVTQPDALPQTA